MKRTLRTVAWLLLAMAMATAGWILDNGVEHLSELRNLQAVAGLFLVVGAPLLSWLGQHPGEAWEADQFEAGAIADRRGKPPEDA